MNTVTEIFTSLGAGAASKVLSAVVALVFGILVINVVKKAVEAALKKSSLEKAAHSLITSVVKFTLYVLLGLSVASGLGIDVTSVVALASVLTLAISLSLQNMLSNVIGGMTVLTTKPFRSGDFVDIGGQAGTVEEITMNYTRLVTPDNKVVNLPNSAVAAAQVVNYSAAPTRRVDVNVGVSYDVPVEKVIDALVAAGSVDKALSDPAPFASVMSYDAHTINYVLRVWTESANYWDVFFAVNNNVKATFEEKGVAFSYPHVNVHMDK